MSRSFLRQVAQIKQSGTFTENVTPGSTMESNSTSLESDLNAIRTQLNRFLDVSLGEHWYNAVPTVNSKQRGIKQLNTNLDTVEIKKILLRSYNLTDVALSGTAAAKAAGSITVVAKASLAAGDFFTIPDGTRSVGFYFDITGSDTPPSGGYGPLKVQVDVSGCTDATSVRDVCITAINGATIDVTTSIGGSAIVTVTHDYKGAFNYTITENVVNAGFTVSGLASGVGGSHTLVQSTGQTPTEAAAVGAGTALGALVASLSGDVGKPEMAVIAGVNAENPKNLCVLHDAATGDPIMDGTHEIYALLQAESGVVDGDSFNDTTKQAQISFVVSNATNDGLEWANADLLTGKTIHLAYVRRTDFLNLPEQAFLAAAFSDQSASVDVTLNNAIDNQSTTPATQQTHVYWQIDDDKVLSFQTSLGANIFEIAPLAALDEIHVAALMTNNNAYISDQGSDVRVELSGGDIIADSGFSISSGSEAAGDLNLDAMQGLLRFHDQYQAGSSWTSDYVHLSDSTAEWDAYETTFGGEVSLFNAIVQAATISAHVKGVGVVSAATIAANTNVTGAGGSPNIAPQLPSYNAITFLEDVNVFLNGQLMRNGADLDADNDCYPGTSDDNGDLKFEFDLKLNDVITLEVHGTAV